MGVLLKLFCQEQFTDRSVCETPTRVLNQSSAIIQIVFFLVLVCVFDSQARKSPRGEVNLRMVDNQRRSGAAIAGFESC
jgi:hypothetical protein